MSKLICSIPNNSDKEEVDMLIEEMEDYMISSNYFNSDRFRIVKDGVEDFVDAESFSDLIYQIGYTDFPPSYIVNLYVYEDEDCLKIVVSGISVCYVFPINNL